MIKAVVAASAVFLCLAGSALAQQQQELGPLPFPVQRGSALPPPTPTAGQTAPPEGVSAHGIDFGQWRNANPATYQTAFQTQVRARFANQQAAAIRTDLEANGFACEDATRLDCRIEIMEQQCAVDWYVVVERGRPEPIAGFERVCVGAR